MSTNPPLGPANWDQFIGQDQLKKRLQTHIRAAYKDVPTRPLEPILLAGPPGFGKTTLSGLIAASLRDALTTLQMPLTRATLVRELRRFTGGVLFLDEIHAMSKRDQELLLPVLEENVIRDDRGRSKNMGFCSIVAATTERDKLIAPLHDRFPIRPDFDPYSDIELGLIVAQMAEKANVEMDDETALILGRASGGIPRQAKQFVFAARDIVIAYGEIPSVEGILDFCNVDEDGLTSLHQRYLEILHQQDGKAGIKTIETLLRVPAGFINDLERLLLQRGLIEFTPSGRVLTEEGENKVVGRETQSYVRR